MFFSVIPNLKSKPLPALIQSESEIWKSGQVSGLCIYKPLQGVANGTSKNVGLGKFWQKILGISDTFLVSLEVSFFHGLFLLFLSLETFHQRVSGSDF